MSIRSVAVIALGMSAPSLAGPLTPALGPPGPANATIERIEPRTPITGPAPIVIDQPGSYYLIANIETTTSGIEIHATNVTLDLNGFTVRGDGEGAANDRGICLLTQDTTGHVVIRNGFVDRFTHDGVSDTTDDQPQLTVEDVHVTRCRYGFYLFTPTTLRRCSAAESRFDGVRTFSPATIQGCVAGDNERDGFSVRDAALSACVARANGRRGFAVAGKVTMQQCGAFENASVGIAESPVFPNTAGVTISHSVAANNGGGGIGLGPGSVVTACAAIGNQNGGIRAGFGSVITACTARGNQTSNGITVASDSLVTDCVATENVGEGFLIGDDSRIVGCVANGNGLAGFPIAGIRAGRRCVIDSNNATGNPVGIDAAEDTIIIRNTLGMNTLNLDAPNAKAGPLATDPATETSPWANFAF
ncbi:MAG: right-handed parallel beta-helix repeat-containing protein [Planctomycetota bacterium]